MHPQNQELKLSEEQILIMEKHKGGEFTIALPPSFLFCYNFAIISLRIRGILRIIFPFCASTGTRVTWAETYKT